MQLAHHATAGCGSVARLLRAGGGNSSRTCVVRAVPPQQQQQQLHHSSAQLPGAAALAATAAAASVLQLCALQLSSAAAAVPPSSFDAASWRPVLGDLALEAAALPAPELMDDITEQVALPPELLQFMEVTQQGRAKDLGKLQEARRAVGFERSPDGRVVLFTEDGEPFQVKNDMGVPGMLLLRDSGGYCYYLPAAEGAPLQQIDLSDDAVVAQLFANHAWEELVEPLEVMGDVQESGGGAGEQQQQQQSRIEQLRLTEREFRSVLSLAAGGLELPEEPLEELDAQER